MSPLRLLFCGIVIAGTLAMDLSPIFAADLHNGRRRSAAGDIYAEDLACPVQEPRDYKPRIANFNQPLCYAARPYGISTHTYDQPRELRVADPEVGY